MIFTSWMGETRSSYWGTLVKVHPLLQSRPLKVLNLVIFTSLKINSRTETNFLKVNLSIIDFYQFTFVISCWAVKRWTCLNTPSVICKNDRKTVSHLCAVLQTVCNDTNIWFELGCCPLGVCKVHHLFICRDYTLTIVCETGTFYQIGLITILISHY